MKSKRYPNLYLYSNSPYWVFRKYSTERRRQFTKSTGEKQEPAAYREGIRLFNDWLGIHLPARSGRPILIKDIARAILAGKQGKRKTTEASARVQILNHLIPGFGHLRPDQVTSLRWQLYDQEERRKGKRTKLYNTRKALMECLIRAKEEGLIRDVPKLKSFDPPADPPRYISGREWWQIRRALSPKVRLLAFIMYRQGARPREILHYRWDMIQWDGERAKIAIPAAITKTARARTIPLNTLVENAFRRLYGSSESDWIFPRNDGVNAPTTEYAAVWGRSMKRLGMDYTPYNLRDTFITNRLMEGISATFIGKYVDSSAQMIEKRYAVAVDGIMNRVAG